MQLGCMKRRHHALARMASGACTQPAPGKTSQSSAHLSVLPSIFPLGCTQRRGLASGECTFIRTASCCAMHCHDSAAQSIVQQQASRCAHQHFAAASQNRNERSKMITVQCSNPPASCCPSKLGMNIPNDNCSPIEHKIAFIPLQQPTSILLSFHSERTLPMIAFH